MKLKPKPADQFAAHWAMLGAANWEGEEYPTFEKEYTFDKRENRMVGYSMHKSREWRFDFAWPDVLVAVEIDGGVFMPKGGRHNRGATYALDCEKLNTAIAMGWVVFRLTDREISRNPVPTLFEIARLIRRRRIANVRPNVVETYAMRPVKRRGPKAVAQKAVKSLTHESGGLFDGE